MAAAVSVVSPEARVSNEAAMHCQQPYHVVHAVYLTEAT
jgi:hypothetical protein